MVKSYNYLGVIIDNNLNWVEPIKMVKSKLLKAIGVRYITRYFFNKKSFLFTVNLIKVNEINVLINKALRCIHYKKYNESVSNLKLTKKKC